jgi:hypothetical protein
MARSKQTYALVALPLILAVALLTLCLPVTCAVAGPMPVNCGNGGAMPAPHIPAHAPSPADTACKHQAVSAASVTPDQSVLLGTVSAVAQTPVAVTSPLVTMLVPDVHASPPPGILLTASQLRV